VPEEESLVGGAFELYDLSRVEIVDLVEEKQFN